MGKIEEYITESVRYSPNTGKLFRVLKTGAEKEVALSGTKGYRQVSICGKILYAHRVAFFCMTSRWPEEVDHINGVKDDNRWVNLREASRCGNTQNVGTRSDNTNNIKGVSFYLRRGNFVAQVQSNKKRVSKYFDTKEQATAWVQEKRTELHGPFANQK